MEITVRDLKNNSFTVTIDPTKTVGDLKAKINEVIPITEEQELRIIHAGKILENVKTFPEVKLTSGKTVIMLHHKKKVVTAPVIDTKSVEPMEENNNIIQQSSSLINEINTPDIPSELNGINSQELMELAQTYEQIQQNPEFKDQFIDTIYEQMTTAGLSITKEELTEKLNDPQFFMQLMMVGQQMQTNGAFPDEYKMEVTPEEKADIDELQALGFPIEQVYQCYKACGNKKDDAANLLYSMRTEENIEDISEIQKSLELNEEEITDIDEIISLGFEKEKVIQYFIACDKNKNSAINMLLDG
jgi:UV excision repair protein RAD23